MVDHDALGAIRQKILPSGQTGAALSNLDADGCELDWLPDYRLVPAETPLRS
jgi:hypothetical protein